MELWVLGPQSSWGKRGRLPERASLTPPAHLNLLHTSRNLSGKAAGKHPKAHPLGLGVGVGRACTHTRTHTP